MATALVPLKAHVVVHVMLHSLVNSPEKAQHSLVGRGGREQKEAGRWGWGIVLLRHQQE
jgi:hypothetical protein